MSRSRNLFFASLLFALTTCKFGSVDYAVGDVQLTSKVKTEVAGRPAVRLHIENSGDEAVTNIRITVKAKRKQRDLEVQILALDRLSGATTITRTVVFSRLTTHSDYDLLTYAVAFSQ